MAYLDELASLVNEAFNRARDEADLRKRIARLVVDKSKESFKNGYKTARNRYDKPIIKRALKL